MALEIKTIPTLYGEAAERFLKLVEATPEEAKPIEKFILEKIHVYSCFNVNFRECPLISR